jgi:hypothetical protein
VDDIELVAVFGDELDGVALVELKRVVLLRGDVHTNNVESR